MIEFRQVSLRDRLKVLNIVRAAGCYGADYNFANIFIWRDFYKPEIYFTETRMLMRVKKFDFYAYPKGEGEIKEPEELLLKDAHERGRKLVLGGLTEHSLEEFLPVYGERFNIREHRDNADYIYDAEKLCSLPGRKLSSKRNHINHFMRNGDWHFERVTSENLKSAEDFVRKFYEIKNDPELEAEKEAMRQMFGNYRELGFHGGLLYQFGEPVAFTAGTLMAPEMFDVHFEKALPDADGAYTMVNMQFANMIKSVYPEVTFINREEDLGIEGLRRSKLSYHPDILLMKYVAEEK